MAMTTTHSPGSGNLEAKIILPKLNQLDLALKAQEVPTSIFNPWLDGTKLQGTLSGQTKMRNFFHKMSGMGIIRVDNAKLNDADFGKISATFEANAGQINLKVAAIENTLTGEFNINQKNDYSFAGTLSFINILANKLVPLPPALKAITSGSVFAQGTLEEIEKIGIDSELNQLHLKIHDQEFRNEGPIRMQLSEKLLTIEPSVITNGQLRGTLRGTLDENGQVQLTTSGTGDFKELLKLVELSSGKAPINFALQIDGPLNNPSISGRAVMSDAHLKVDSLGLELNELESELRFSGRTVHIENFSGHIKDGIVNGQGNMILHANQKPEFDLLLDINEVYWKPLSNLDLVASGQLQLNGLSNELQLRGDIELQSLRYDANIDLKHLLGLANQSQGIESEAQAPINLRIKLKADDNIIFINNFIESELQAELDLTGTTQRIGLLGSASLIWANITLGGNNYRVQHATVDFIDEYAIRPRYDLRATTEACGLSLMVMVRGDADRYTISATGQDDSGPVEPQEALLCAQFGLRLDSLNTANLGGENGEGLGVLPGAMDALWKVTGMDSQIKNYLPLVDQFSLTSGYSKTSRRIEPRIQVSKELGAKWQLEYNGPLYEQDEQHVFSLEYNIKPGVILEGTWVSESRVTIGDLGLDLRLDWKFD